METPVSSEQAFENAAMEKIAERDFATALRNCEELEFETIGAQATDAQAHARYCRQLTLYLITNDMDNARHLWRRIGNDFKGVESELSAIWSIASNLWHRNNIPMVFKSLRQTWSPEIAPLMQKFIETIRDRQFELLSKAYMKVTLAATITELSLPEDEVVEYCVKRGWKFDPTIRVFEPSTPPVKDVSFDGIQHLDYLAKHITSLEEKRLTADPAVSS
uniref:COP9 signalosome complex subunit 8 n=1 Tax=Octactis speculum TaxID=3111310 RepID=A0A7S2GZT5_9STRA|mmetsp:Transcript_59857/g.81872  ORF Transcript_59857/g.81872 Transcript_59857/m.81872 type:complete len:219 (+) Transcript_59857:32-688(+)